jgi:transposase
MEDTMELVYGRVAGIDVHKRTVTACCRLPAPDGRLHKETRSFHTMTVDLLALADWLTQLGITHIAMESTGEYWKPLYAMLEPTFEVLVVNAQHLKNVPGRKTDVKDAEWIAELLSHGLVRGSFIPPQPQHDLRDLTRQRMNLVQERAAVVNRLQKVLEWANLKLAAVATNVMGVSARSMLEALVAGQDDPTALADLARGQLRQKRAALEQAVEGRVRDHHRFMIAQHLVHIDFLDEQIGVFDAQVIHHIEAQPLLPGDDAAPVADAGSSNWEAAVQLWDEVPGIGRRVAEQLVAEIGTDMHRFPSARHLASWAKLAPGNYERAGKRYSAAIGKGNTWVRSTLIQAAHAAVKVKDSYLAAVYRRIVARRGKKRAIVAVAHKLLVIAYSLLRTRTHYRDRGAEHVDERHKDRLLERLSHRIQHLGYTVQLEPRPPGSG